MFTCYDHPLIPRTNNDLELFIKGIKRKHRRITGLRRWNRYILRHGELIVFVGNAINDPHVLSRLLSVSYEDYREEWECWYNRIQEHRKQLRFRKIPSHIFNSLWIGGHRERYDSYSANFFCLGYIRHTLGTSTLWDWSSLFSFPNSMLGVPLMS